MTSLNQIRNNSGRDELQLSPPKSRANSIKSIVNKMPASGAKVKGGADQRRELQAWDQLALQQQLKKRKSSYLCLASLPGVCITQDQHSSVHLYNSALIYCSRANIAGNDRHIGTCMCHATPGFLFHLLCVKFVLARCLRVDLGLITTKNSGWVYQTMGIFYCMTRQS